MTKMIDVAEYAGVSVKTVSRVLNNEPHVRDVLRAKVMNAIDALGYVPSASARNLRARRTYRIVVVTHSLKSSFVHTVQFGALRACQQAGYQMQVSMLETDIVTKTGYIDTWLNALMLNGSPDGVILVPPLTEHDGVNTALRARGIPIVRIGPSGINDNETNVVIDDRAASTEVVLHLVELGHARIGFVLGKEEQGATHERFEGYKDGLRRSGIEFDPTLVKQGLFTFESGLRAGMDLLALEPRPTAVFAANDDMAAGVSVAAWRNKLNLPDDLSVVGFDDSEIAKKMWPSLTTIRQPVQQFGFTAAQLLIAAAERPGTERERNVTLAYELIKRNSTSRVGVF